MGRRHPQPPSGNPSHPHPTHTPHLLLSVHTGADSGLLFKASFMIAAQYANATYHLDSFSTDMMVIRAAHLLPFFRQIDQASAVGVVGTT